MIGPITRSTTVALAIGACALVACATSPPSQLVAARNAYRTASAGPASADAPDELVAAQKALARAERSWNADDDTAKVIDLGYIAQRRSELATVIAKRRVAAHQAEALKTQREALTDSLRKETAKELVSTKDALAAESRRTQDAARARIQAERQADAAEREADAARSDARATELRMEKAREELERWAQLVETQRGLVITLSSGILFATAEADILPAASGRLDAVANLLMQTPERRVRVEGHTDNAGGNGYNQGLSQARADAVRAYLVTHGVSPSRVAAIGYGETHPIATNDTVEGRANNRRVEIVLEPLPAPPVPSPSTTPPPITRDH